MGVPKKRHNIYLPRDTFRKCRISFDLTQRQLAEIFLVTETTVRNIEAGRGIPSQDFMVKAAEFFKTDIFELFPEAPLLRHLKKVKFTRS